MSQWKSDLFIGKLTVCWFRKWSETFPYSKYKPSYAWLNFFSPTRKKCLFLPQNFFHLFQVWIQDNFLAQMKKIKFCRACQCHYEALEIFFWKKWPKIDFWGPSEIWPQKMIFFTQKLPFIIQGKKNSIAFFSAYIWS